MSDGFLLVKEVAEMLRVSDETVYRLCRRKQLKATRIGGLWRISREAVDDLLRTGQSNGSRAATPTSK